MATVLVMAVGGLVTNGNLFCNFSFLTVHFVINMIRVGMKGQGPCTGVRKPWKLTLNSVISPILQCILYAGERAEAHCTGGGRFGHGWHCNPLPRHLLT
jgi:hypothetical protein